jgi:hypothetical protein
MPARTWRRVGSVGLSLGPDPHHHGNDDQRCGAGEYDGEETGG